MIEATDRDQGRNAEIIYSIESGDDGKFKINKSSGEVYVSGMLDRDPPSKPRYTLRIRARDNPDLREERQSNDTVIMIELLDINDNSPSFGNQLLVSSVKENEKLKTVIFRLSATDIDAGKNGEITYGILMTEPPGDWFDVSQSGDVVVNISLIDHVNEYNVTVIAKDGGSPQHITTAVVRITVEDVNLNPPEFTSDGFPTNASLKILENLCIGSPVFTFNATDRDYGLNAEVRYQFENGTGLDYSTFSLDAVSGSLSVKSEMDRETNPAGYHFRIKAMDRGSPPLSTSKDISVVLIDVNDNPPTFRDSQFSLPVQENRNNLVIGNVTATDKDGSNGIIYSILDGRYSDQFGIDSNTGAIRLIEPLDREAVSAVNLKIQAKDVVSSTIDNGGCHTPRKTFNNTETTVKVIVIDVNDNPPRFHEPMISRGIRKNAESRTTVVDLKQFVTDADSDPENRKHDFILLGEIQMEKSLKDALKNNQPQICEGDGMRRQFCLSRNGTVLTNMLFQYDYEGYFNLSVLVNDTAGNSTTLLRIYLILDSQMAKMVFLGTNQHVLQINEAVMAAWSRITRMTFVSENIRTHINTAGQEDPRRSDLFFYVVDPTTNRILSAEETQSLIDQHLGLNPVFGRNLTQQYFFLEVQKAVVAADTGMDNSTRTRYILIGFVVLLTLTLSVLIFLFWGSNNRFKRRLKAAKLTTGATIKKAEKTDILPGSNKYAQHVNPVFSKDGAIYDEIHNIDQPDRVSLNSIDSNIVDPNREKPMQSPGLEEREMTIDMYGDDGYVSGQKVNPLMEVLQARNRQEERDNDMQYESDDDSSTKEIFNFDLEKEDFETTEI